MKRIASQTLPPEETALFCEQVALVLKAGIPLYDGMETLAASYRGSRYEARFEQIRDCLMNNGTLCDALESTGIFPRYVCAMSRIGERAGKLDEVMSALADYYQWEADIRTSVKNAILYPTMLVVMLAAVIAILVINVLPVFRRVFESLGLPAGAPAEAALRVGVGVGKAMLVVAGVFVVLLIALGILLKTERRDSVIDSLGRVLPSVRRVSTRLSAGRFAAAISMMLAAGYPLEEAMKLAPAVVTDRRYRTKIESCGERLRNGESFAEAVAESELFDGMHVKMIRFGAAAGKIDAVMTKLRDVYMADADDAIHVLVSMVEPTLVAVLSVVIGGILLSVMLPLLSILASMS